MTLYLWDTADRQRIAADGTVSYEPLYADPVVTYVAGPRGEADTYVFPAAGVSGCIIDYSRCILGPAFRPRLEEGRSAQYAAHFYRDQVARVMRTLHRYAPAFVEKHEPQLRAAVLANYDAVFPILCTVDFIAIGRNVAAALVDAMSSADKFELRPFEVSPRRNRPRGQAREGGRGGVHRWARRPRRDGRVCGRRCHPRVPGAALSSSGCSASGGTPAGTHAGSGRRRSSTRTTTITAFATAAPITRSSPLGAAR